MVDEGVVPNVSTYEYHIVNGENAQNTPRESQMKGIMSSNTRLISRSDWVTVGILCYVNLINYMDRSTVAGEYKLYSLNIFSSNI